MPYLLALLKPPWTRKWPKAGQAGRGSGQGPGNGYQAGDFVAKGNAARQAATGGTAIAKALFDQLTKRGVNVSGTAELLVSGEFRDATDKDSKTTALQIKAKIEDRRGEP